MDRKLDIFPKHILNGTLYNTAAVSASIDMAKHDQAVLLLSITSVATSPCTFIVQDSADGTTFAATSYTFDEAVGTVNDTRFIFIRAQDVRRYVRLRLTPGGSVTMSAAAIQLAANMPPEDVTWSIDTSA